MAVQKACCPEDYRSLRHIMRDMKPEVYIASEQRMMPLRLGR